MMHQLQQAKPKDPTTGNGGSSGRAECRQCGGLYSCSSTCPTKTGRK